MLHKVLFILTLSTICMCQNSVIYCVVDSASNGIMLDDGEGKDSVTIFSTSKFLDNTTITINFTTNSEWKHFQVYSSFNDTHLDKIILDKRWESLINEHDDSTEIQNLLNSATDFYASIKKNRSEGFQWYHFKKKGIDLYSCEEYASSCSKKIETESPYKYYDDNSGHGIIWKIHNYTFLFTDKDNVTEMIYESLDKCEIIKRGCLSMYLVACPNCELVLELYTSEKVKNETLENKTKTEENHNQNYTLHYQGNGEWETIRLNLTDFNSCIVIRAHTQGHIYNDTQKKLWAIGDIAYLSKTLDCQENKRYLEFNTTDESNVVCESSINQRINLTSKLPNPRKQRMVYNPTPNAKSIEKPLKVFHLFNQLDLFIIIIAVSAVLLIFLVGSSINLIISRTRSKDNLPSDESVNENTELLSMENSTDYEILKSGQPIKAENFARYVTAVCDSSSNILQTEFSTIPMGYINKCIEGVTIKNREKNYSRDNCPYDKNRVKLSQRKRSSDYINASFVQGFNNYKEYIIAQNPLHSTLQDFWIMIWEQKIEHIVMISGRDVNFVRYWPTEEETIVRFDKIEIILKNMNENQYYIERMLTVKCKRVVREITHFHYFTWEHDSNLSPHAFISFINRLLEIPHHSAPILFHSRSGIGGAGTMVLCDIALRALPITGTINLYSTVQNLRKDRINLVPTLGQYKLAHLIIKDILK